MNKIIAMMFALLVLTGCGKSAEEIKDDKAWQAIQDAAISDDGIRMVQEAGREQVLKDAKALCSNVSKHEYRSDADSATNMKFYELSYHLAVTEGVYTYCPTEWEKAKKKG
jgi:hypothetical protein